MTMLISVRYIITKNLFIIFNYKQNWKTSLRVQFKILQENPSIKQMLISLFCMRYWSRGVNLIPEL